MSCRRALAVLSIVILIFTTAALPLSADGGGSDGLASEPSHKPADLSASLSSYSCGTPVRIMPLGDSITAGTGTEPLVGYRQSLYLQLTAAGFEVDFVGSHNGGGTAVPDFDIQYEGVGGTTDDYVASNVYAWLTANPADIVLLHIGTNDMDANRYDPSMDDLNLLLDQIDLYDPAVKVVLAQIINRQPYSPETSQFNLDIAAMAATRITAGDDIILVNMEPALNYAVDMWDEEHPNLAGYNKMANVWFAALQGVLPNCNGTPTPVPTPTNLTPEVVLADFSAFWKGSDVALDWSTTTEIDHAVFNLFRSTDMVNWSPIHSEPSLLPCGDFIDTPAQPYSFTDTGVVTGTTYYYHLQFSSAGCGGASGIMVDDDTILEADPQPVALTIASILENGNDVRLSWVHTLPNLSYEVWRSSSPYSTLDGPGDLLLASLTPTAQGQLMTIVDTTVPVDEPVFFFVRSVNSLGSITSAAEGRFKFVMTPGG